MLSTNHQRELNALTLAGLLHDVGKLLHRENQKTYARSHHETSADFIRINQAVLQNDPLYDFELVRFLVRYHHPVKDQNKKNKTKDDILLDTYFSKAGAVNKETAWNLLKLLKRADSYSCKERDIEKQDLRRGNKRLAPLDSIFSKIRISSDLNLPEELHRYHLNPMNPLDCNAVDFEWLREKEITDSVDRFRDTDRVPNVADAASFSEVLIPLLNYMLDGMWAVPSDTRYEYSDVSLYDHSRTTAAIAHCLYKRHQAEIGGVHGLSQKSEFFFIGGDFSGIQNYIFEVTHIGSGGAAKRLRARSMFISMFCEATIHKILDSLHLPVVCNLFSAGGKFLLLAPCIPGIEKKLIEVKKAINQEIHKTYFSRFAFLLHWIEIIRYEKEADVYQFYEMANNMFHQLESEKNRKHASVLTSVNGTWDMDAFRATALYQSYIGEGDCTVCGKGPALFADSHEDPTPVQCALCYQDKHVIGATIPRCTGIAFYMSQTAQDKESRRIGLFHQKPAVFAELLDDRQPTPYEDVTFVYHFAQTVTGQAEGKFWHRYYANYVPTQNGNICTFDEIAAFPDKHDNQTARDGSSVGMLGVIKVDVDNLGLIFNKGFEIPTADEANIPTSHRKTISRFLTLSRMTDLFFSGWIRNVLDPSNQKQINGEMRTLPSLDATRWQAYLGAERKPVDFSMIYTVYAGGDDMVLIGPWETMIIFSYYMQRCFATFTGHNPSITLSGGLAFVKARFPAARAIQLADESLTASKEKGKDRLTLFGRTFKWEQLPELINLFLFFDEKVRDNNSNINTGFLHRLLEYHRLALRYIDGKEISGLKYLSALSYDLGRNIVQRDKTGQIVKGLEELRFLHPLIRQSPEPKSLISNLVIPVSWALYRNRTVES